MHISSLTSILTAAINAFNFEAGTSASSGNEFHIGVKSGVVSTSYMTFLNNEGDAQLCSSSREGYRSYLSNGSQDAATLEVSNMTGNNTLCGSSSWKLNGVNAYNVTLCAEDDTTEIVFNLMTNGKNYVTLLIDGYTYSPVSYSIHDTPCDLLAFSYSGGSGSGWSSENLVVD